jgi:hypothetical protein
MVPPGSDSPAEVGEWVAAVVAATPAVRLYVPPPLDSLPALPGRPPPGVRLESDRVEIHLAVGRSGLADLAREVAAAVRPGLAGTPWSEVPIHVHVDELDGPPAS